jgi:hypothetical protein
VTKPQGDILVTDQGRYYAVQGFLPNRHSYFDPRISGYKLISGNAGGNSGKSKAKRARSGQAGNSGEAKKNWEFEAPSGGWLANTPMTGNAILKAGDVLFIAGSKVQHPVGQFDKIRAGYEGHFGNTLWVASAVDGKKRVEYELEAPPVWDGMAAVSGKLLVALRNGTLVCYGKE